MLLTALFIRIEQVEESEQPNDILCQFTEEE